MCFCYSLRNLFAPWTWEPARQSSLTTLRTGSTVSGESCLRAHMLHEPVTNQAFDADSKIKDKQAGRQAGSDWITPTSLFSLSAFIPRGSRWGCCSLSQLHMGEAGYTRAHMSRLLRALFEHLRVWYLAQGYLGSALKVYWHIPCYRDTFHLLSTIFVVQGLSHEPPAAQHPDGLSPITSITRF